jgi:hypothetical protein
MMMGSLVQYIIRRNQYMMKLDDASSYTGGIGVDDASSYADISLYSTESGSLDALFKLIRMIQDILMHHLPKYMMMGSLAQYIIRRNQYMMKYLIFWGVASRL